MDPCFIVPKMAKLDPLSSKSYQNIISLPDDYAEESTKSSNRREKKVLKSLAIHESSPMLDPYHTFPEEEESSFEVRLPKNLI